MRIRVGLIAYIGDWPLYGVGPMFALGVTWYTLCVGRWRIALIPMIKSTRQIGCFLTQRLGAC